MIFRLSFRQIRRNAVESVIIWIQLFLTVLIIAEVGTMLANAKFSAESVYTTGFDQLSFYQEHGSGGLLEATLSGSSQDDLQQMLEQAEEPAELSRRVMHVATNTMDPESVPENPNNGSFATLQAVDSALAARTVLPLSEGEWFDPNWDEANGYQAIASTTFQDHFKIGESYTVQLSDVGNTQVRITIIGYLDRNNYGYPEIIPLGNNFLQKDFYGLILSAKDPDRFGRLSFVDTGYVDGIVSEDTAEYFIVPMTQKLQEFIQREYSNVATFSILGGVVIALALFGICCSTIIKTGYDTKRYAIMSFCGARWRDCVQIELWKSLIIYLTSMAAVSVLLWVVIPLQDMQRGNTSNLSPEAFWLGIAVAFLLYIPAALWKVWHTAKQNPIEVIKED